MKNLTILVPEGQNNLESIVGPYNIFSRANKYREERGSNALFKIQLAGISDKVNFYNGLFTVNIQNDIWKIEDTDLIIIPSLNHNYREAVRGNKEIINWIAQQYKTGTEIASICTGAFLLASSGLLNDKRCSTHWSVAEKFKNMFPNINVQKDKLITDEDGIYTNGGAYSFLNLMLYLIEKYYDRHTAIYCSKVFQIEMDRQSQSSFIIFKGQKKHGDKVVMEAQEYIEKKLHEKISIKQLASRFPISRRQFDRRFIKATGNTPFEYLQMVRVEKAKQLMETSRKTVQEVMYKVGYSDAGAFRNVFKDITGRSPVEYRNKYNKDAAVTI